MKRMRNHKLSRHTDILLQANDVLKIATFMHNNPDAVSTALQEEPEVYGSTKSWNFKTGEVKEIQKEESSEESTPSTPSTVDVRSTVDIFSTDEDSRRLSTWYEMNGNPVMLSRSGAIPYSFQYSNVNTKTGQNTNNKFTVHDFDSFSTPASLNAEAWLFRSMSIDINLIMSYLQKHNCPNITLYLMDIPFLMEKFGLDRSTVQDIQELQ